MTTGPASTWTMASRSDEARRLARLRAASVAVTCAPLGARRACGRPGQPLLVDPVRAGRPARRRAADRGRPRPLGDLLQPRRPRPAKRVVVPSLHGVGPVGARLDRSAARPQRPRLLLVHARSRSVAAGGCVAALAGRGHEPGLVLPHAAEVPRAPGAASDRPARAARRRRAPPRPTSTRGSPRTGPGSPCRAGCRNRWASG